MAEQALKVGELARRTGLTIRTLHHYDEIGLLRPSLHTEAGHRLYAAGDVASLQQIVSLRQLGFSLDEVRDCLQGPDFSPLAVIGMHLARLREQIEWQRKLCERLEAVAAHLGAAGEVSVDEFLRTIEVMTMIENYYTPEQLEQLKQRRTAGGEAMEQRMQQVPQEWATLFADLRAALEQGIDPADPRAQAIEKRRQSLVNEFTGGDPAMEQSLQRLWKEQGANLSAQYGYDHDPQLLAYLDQISQAAKSNS